ncbi:hypothetical protein BCAR13_980028 [Paraburkholderia caribensis]|nr:hypothetical protein BCAR13_980028 [Paraburkholderia caribensis]
MHAAFSRWGWSQRDTVDEWAGDGDGWVLWAAYWPFIGRLLAAYVGRGTRPGWNGAIMTCARSAMH